MRKRKLCFDSWYALSVDDINAIQILNYKLISKKAIFIFSLNFRKQYVYAFGSMNFSRVSYTDKETVGNLTVSTEDGFEVVNMYVRPNSSQGANLYPTHPTLPYAVTPNVLAFTPGNNVNSASGKFGERSSHPLDGIPFKLSPALELSSSPDSDPVLEDVKNTLSRVGRLLYSDEFKYDCSLERNVLRDN